MVQMHGTPTSLMVRNGSQVQRKISLALPVHSFPPGVHGLPIPFWLPASGGQPAGRSRLTSYASTGGDRRQSQHPEETAG